MGWWGVGAWMGGWVGDHVCVCVGGGALLAVKPTTRARCPCPTQRREPPLARAPPSGASPPLPPPPPLWPSLTVCQHMLLGVAQCLLHRQHIHAVHLGSSTRVLVGAGEGVARCGGVPAAAPPLPPASPRSPHPPLHPHTRTHLEPRHVVAASKVGGGFGSAPLGRAHAWGEGGWVGLRVGGFEGGWV